MATITGLTAERMIEMENQTVVDGDVVGNDLILKTRDNTTINAGNVRGPVGPAGPTFITCTSTTRPTLSPAEEGKAIYETDTDLTRIWDGARWKLQEQLICTSTTRPTGLVAADEGIYIHETDSHLQFVWSGTTWNLVGGFPVFASAANRDAVITSPTVGMGSYLLDIGAMEVYTAKTTPSSWRKPWGLPWGRLASKALSGNAGFNQNWYDISAAGVTINGMPAGRLIDITVNVAFYVPIDAVSIGVRTERGGPTVVLAEKGGRTNTDSITFDYTVQDQPPAGNTIYRIAARTSHNADIATNSTWLRQMTVTDVGPAA